MRRTLIPTLLILCGMWVAPASAHDWYTGLKSPTGIPCCAKQDCESAQTRVNVYGDLEVELDGAWFPAFDERWYLPGSPSQDGEWHVCRGATSSEGASVPRCTIGPGWA